MPERGVLVMSYGTPRSLEEVASYYTDIRHGRPPPPHLLDELTARYRAIGGRSPLYEITRAQAAGIEARTGVRTYVGQKHAPPFIDDAVASLAAEGVGVCAGLVLAPHYSALSVGDYRARVNRAAARIGWAGRLEMIESWHLEEGYLAFLTGAVEGALLELAEPARRGAVVLFTAHSLPAGILERGDPYPEQLRETAAAVAARAPLERWDVAWQSAGRTEAPWLGPDVTEVVQDLARRGVGAVVICPCGFVADHLEVLYDIDIEARRVADALGIALVRTRSPNDDPAFLDALGRVVARALEVP
ncbi:MAG: ferrochelatase [Actinomycetota bacterium]